MFLVFGESTHGRLPRRSSISCLPVNALIRKYSVMRQQVKYVVVRRHCKILGDAQRQGGGLSRAVNPPL